MKKIMLLVLSGLLLVACEKEGESSFTQTNINGGNIP